MQDLSALEGKSLMELREIGKVLGIDDPALKKKELLDKIKSLAMSTEAEQKNDTVASDSTPQGEAPQKRGRRPRMNTLRIEENKPSSEAVESTRIVTPIPEEVTTEPEPISIKASAETATEPVAQVEQPLADKPKEETPQPKKRGRKPKA
jgi:transcription termination factor Rho